MLSGSLLLLGPEGPYYESGSLIIIDIIIGPVKEYDHFIPETHQGHQMDKHPHEPGKETAETEPGQVHYSLVPADGRHITFVMVRKGFHILPG